MSNALAIAGVTAVLKDLLDDGMIDHAVTDTLGQGVTVSALAPDEIELGADKQPRLNLFLYQVTPNGAWRNIGFPALDASGRRIANPPLALDLHYMLTAYGALDLQAEVLLGYAMLLLHQTPVLARAAIRKSLDPPPSAAVTGSLLPTVYKSLHAANLADQLEQIKITPEVMNTEELSKLWTAIQTHYRPTATYLVTVVLIQPDVATSAPLPVLSRGPRDPTTHLETGPTVFASMQSPNPALSSIVYANGQNSAELGDQIVLNGQNLDGSGQTLLLANPLRGIAVSVTPPTSVSPDSLTFTLPPNAALYPAGTYTASVQLARGTDPAPVVSNPQPLLIAPKITALPAAATLDASGNLTLTPTCTPQLQPNQTASLILGDIQAQATPITVATPTPSFAFTALPPGTYWVRLRVDNVDSHLINFGPPPVFAGPQIVVSA
ncbi:MAG: DUF4255 domain-containing protein [Methylocella sp.]